MFTWRFLSQTKPSSTKKTPIKIQLHFAGLINLINCLLLIQLLAELKMRDLSIAGFNRLNKIGGNTWDIVGANTILCCMSLKWEKLKEQIDKMGAYSPCKVRRMRRNRFKGCS